MWEGAKISGDRGGALWIVSFLNAVWWELTTGSGVASWVSLGWELSDVVCGSKDLCALPRAGRRLDIERI